MTNKNQKLIEIPREWFDVLKWHLNKVDQEKQGSNRYFDEVNFILGYLESTTDLILKENDK